MNIEELTVGQLRQLAKLASGLGGCEQTLEKKRVVLVIDRGWIAAGDQSLTTDGYIKLENAVHVRSWSGVGFDGMLTEWKTEKVVIRKLAHDPEIPEKSIIFRVPVPAGWGVK